MSATIAALNVYPVKGCRGIALGAAAATVRGLAMHAVGDREWMIVDAAGRFVTQREQPRMALIGVRVHAHSLELDAPGMPRIDVVSADVARAPRREVVVWRSTVDAIDAGEPAARWLTEYFGSPMRLARFAPEHVRACNPDFVGASGAHTAFADGYPMLVIGEASLADLNLRLTSRGERPVPMNRFRPNVVLAGLEPYDEDHLDTIEACGVVLKLVKPCVRCRVTTTDQLDATVGNEPLATLSGYRMSERFGGVTFGMNAIVVEGAGRTLDVGAPAALAYRF